jgi:hypothetical protein
MSEMKDLDRQAGQLDDHAGTKTTVGISAVVVVTTLVIVILAVLFIWVL